MVSFDTLRYLSRADVLRVCPPAGAIADRIESLLSAVASGGAVEAPKASITPGPGRHWLALLSGSSEPSLAVFKTLGLSVDNAARGLPHIGSLMVAHDGETGMPVAIMDAEHITGVRTAAVSLVAARRLARKDARRIAFIGCGLQARCHFDAFGPEFPLDAVSAYSRREESAQALCEHVQAAGASAEVCTDPGEAIRDADMVVTTIPDQPGLQPFLDANTLSPGAFLAAVDLGRSWIPESFTAFDRIVVENLAKHAAAPMVTTAPVESDLTSLLGESPRTDAQARLAFVFRGLALGDLAAVSLCLERAADLDAGTMLER